jgi:hypothetical protein
MINLNYLIILPFIFIGLLLILSTHNSLKGKLVRSNSLKQVTILEENENDKFNILNEYYSRITNLDLIAFPSLRAISFSRLNLK